MKKYIAVILMSSVLLTGCSSKITEGEIYKKDYQPEETIMIMTPMIHTNGKSSYTTYIPMFYHYSDRWCIWIKATEKNDEGEYDTAKYYTTEEVYEECDIGDMFSYEEDRDYKEEPVEKKRIRNEKG